jgi:hypothetical protein
MVKFVLLLLLTGLPLTMAAAEQMTVEQLESALKPARHMSDKNLANQLRTVELTERLSSTRLAGLRAGLPGEKSRLALIPVSDLSGFLDLPAADIPSTPALDRGAQRALLAKSRDYVESAISRLPDFIATEDTIHFVDTPPKASHFHGKGQTGLQMTDRLESSVHIVQGKEVKDAAAKGEKPEPAGKRLVAAGVFGSILSAVFEDVLRADLEWGHWEQAVSGPIAVFRYAVAPEKSHYIVQVPGDPGALRTVTGYRGELSMDPATGAILRLTVKADLWLTGPVSRADILVEYGPVEIGGKIYICPLHSVAISVSRPFNLLEDVYGVTQGSAAQSRMQLNDTAFEHYHVFRSEARIVPEGEAEQPRNGPGAAPAPQATPSP